MRITRYLKIFLGALAAGAMLGATPAHAQAGAEKPPTAGASAPATISKGDQKIVTDMAQASMGAIEMGKLAQVKSQNLQVKAFAQQMIDDHTKALTEVQQLATSKGVAMPTEVDKKHKAMADKLGALSGDAFDKAYIAQGGVGEHKKMHAMLASAEKKARDPDVKALAARIAPAIDQHLKAAQQMGSTKDGAKGDKPPAGTQAGK
jgi:putative membrane protein